MPGRPTPTQDELNKIALGEKVELSDDGSGPDPNVSTLDPRAVPKATPKVEHETGTTHHTSRSRV